MKLVKSVPFFSNFGGILHFEVKQSDATRKKKGIRFRIGNFLDLAHRKWWSSTEVRWPTQSSGVEIWIGRKLAADAVHPFHLFPGITGVECALHPFSSLPCNLFKWTKQSNSFILITSIRVDCAVVFTANVINNSFLRVDPGGLIIDSC